MAMTEKAMKQLYTSILTAKTTLEALEASAKDQRANYDAAAAARNAAFRNKRIVRETVTAFELAAEESVLNLRKSVEVLTRYRLSQDVIDQIRNELPDFKEKLVFTVADNGAGIVSYTFDC